MILSKSPHNRKVDGDAMTKDDISKALDEAFEKCKGMKDPYSKAIFAQGFAAGVRFSTNEIVKLVNPKS